MAKLDLNATPTNYRRFMSAGSLIGDKVYNAQGEHLGKIEEIMLDTVDGKVGYAVLSFGGFLGVGDKLFAIPWAQLSLDEANKCFILNIDKERLQAAPGFDKDNWPDMADPTWSNRIRDYYSAGFSTTNRDRLV